KKPRKSRHLHLASPTKSKLSVPISPQAKHRHHEGSTSVTTTYISVYMNLVVTWR
ncbi:hypothetical protein M440DRAFT_1338424, partial [Trichoderma longibrachiatum ATCC 18648]